MRVSRLALTDFRNYRAADVELVDGANLLVGRNGQGKTNMVESLVWIATGSSHRVPNDFALIRAGEERAIVRCTVTNDARSFQLDVELNARGANRAQANGQPVRIRDLPRYLQAVLFSPEDLQLVRADPGGRRRFLDELSVMRAPRLAGVHSDLDRVLKQRNSLLKSARAARLRPDDLTTLEVWDGRLVELGLEVMRARRALVADLAPHVDAAYRLVAGDEHEARIELTTNVPDSAEAFHAILAERRRDELDRGVSLVGPHRDDLELQLNDLLARHYASHGESWSFALALRLGSAELLRDGSGGDPVMILDDVFAELDAGRRQRLAEAAGRFEQVLITAAVEEDVPDALRHHRIRIDRGEVLDA
ncbi:DNA replication/repair protein RecF [Agrococcus sp. Marseille-Q4369]|uniref:DNA replication/repair protein RecF n=1 Tax=Agrococcus sp. Marseille-Q4369 TaxID=2810513 RepID=UPI001B8B751F|nr:DNA replication/repair protein RecF [Agrococcus sp. Marseille-Q4369]QUW17995.1 DNA replication/repair protein RecF [Agrococcus sp. Marseille-Q4369]